MPPGGFPTSTPWFLYRAGGIILGMRILAVAGDDLFELFLFHSAFIFVGLISVLSWSVHTLLTPPWL